MDEDIELKTAWLIGDVELSTDFEDKILSRGYMIRKIAGSKEIRAAYDDMPDLILFSEADRKNFSAISRLRDFFPSVVMISMPEPPLQLKPLRSAAAKSMVSKNAKTSESTFQVSMERLLQALRRIEDHP
jgi:hypothetical protein